MGCAAGDPVFTEVEPADGESEEDGTLEPTPEEGGGSEVGLIAAIVCEVGVEIAVVDGTARERRRDGEVCDFFPVAEEPAEVFHAEDAVR